MPAFASCDDIAAINERIDNLVIPPDVNVTSEDASVDVAMSVVDGVKVFDLSVQAGGAATEVASAAETLKVTGTATTGFNVELERMDQTPEGLANNLQQDPNTKKWYSDPPESAVVRMSIPPGTQQTIAAGATSVGVNVTTAFAVGNTTLIVPDTPVATNSCVKLKPGFDYEFQAQLAAEIPAGNSLSFQFQTSEGGPTGPWSNRQLVGVLDRTGSAVIKNNMPSGIWSPTVDTWLRLAVVGAVGSGSKVNNPAGAGMTGISWIVRMIGKKFA